MSLIIRKLQPADRPSYRQVRLDCLREFPASFGSSYEEEREKPELHFEGRIEAQSDSEFMMGVFDGETLVGICGFLRESRAKTSHRGELVQVYVRPAYAGQGLGRQLLLATIAEAFKDPSLEQIQLGVIAGNVAANSLYERLGFKEFGFLENHLRVNDQYLHQRFMILTRPVAASILSL
ncbi:GNAT family N-acetyltransferase [Hymenobacter terrenus]|uniref:GNAT family N-acetyltransferase n=1 Tax=Hymenobacter terrenus TaxID=1629124 RepID=UPI0006194CB4|nr:GNAT family protein [Hymenobacter terrenus]